jgi:phage terminase large subunit-like protein
VRRFRVAYTETGKGSGKTPFGAGLMLYMMVADGVRGAQVFSAAPTLAQAKDYGFTDAKKMVEASPELQARVDVKANNLAVLETGSFFRPISSEKRGLDGKRVHGVLIDEEHEHAERRRCT